LDERWEKAVIGLALESALVHKRDTRTLVNLYSNPDRQQVRELHDQLMMSGDPFDREVAIWLEPALELGPLKSDPSKLVSELKEMELVLYTLIPRSGEAQRDVNSWMNYIANTAQSIKDDFWIDAKILLSRALQSSRSPSVVGLKADPSLRYEVDVLQKATASYFEEVKGYPLRLKVSDDRLDAVLRVQELLLELTQIHYKENQWEYSEVTRQPIHRLSNTIRYLMDVNREREDAKQEMQRASEELERRLNEFVDREERERMVVYSNRMKDVINTL